MQPICPELVQAVLVVLLGNLKEYLPQNRLKISHLKNYEISGEDSARKMSSSPTRGAQIVTYSTVQHSFKTVNSHPCIK